MFRVVDTPIIWPDFNTEPFRVMKTLFLIPILLTLGMTASTADPLDAAAENTQAERNSLQTVPILRQPRQQANTIVRGKVAYSGIAVQLVKTDRPFHLINPAAPSRVADG